MQYENDRAPTCHNPSRGPSHPEQESRGGDVRPTLDYLVELACKAIVRDAKRGRLAVKAVQR